MEGSDLDMLLKGDLQPEEHPVWAQIKVLQRKAETAIEEIKKVGETEATQADASYSVPLAELGKTMVL